MDDDMINLKTACKLAGCSVAWLYKLYHCGSPILGAVVRPGYKNKPQVFVSRAKILQLAKEMEKEKHKKITHLNGKKVINAKEAMKILGWSFATFHERKKSWKEPLLTPIKHKTYTNKVHLLYYHSDIVTLAAQYSQKERSSSKGTFYTFKDLEDRWEICHDTMDLWNELRYFPVYQSRSYQGQRAKKYLRAHIHKIERERDALLKSYRFVKQKAR